MRAPSRIETERLVLSEPTPEDAAAVFERYASDPDVTVYLGWPRHRTLGDTKAFLAFSMSQWERSGVGPTARRRQPDREQGPVSTDDRTRGGPTKEIRRTSD